MSLVSALTTAIDAYEARLFTMVCEQRLGDLPGHEALTTAGFIPQVGNHRLHYCRSHKAYHVYTGAVFQQVSVQVTGEISALIRGAYPQLTKAERQQLQQHFVRVRGGVERLADQDRLRFSDWKGMWHESQQRVQPKPQPVPRRVKQRQVVKPQPAAPSQSAASKRAAWEMCVASAVQVLTTEQRAEFYRCARKRAYAFAWQAEAGITALGQIPGWERMSVYNCEFCSGWHMGHEAPEYDAHRQVDLRKAQFALTRYMKQAREFLTDRGIDVDALQGTVQDDARAR